MDDSTRESRHSQEADVIIVAGAPGSGKTTVCRLVQAETGWPLIELGRLREFHLDRAWHRARRDEEHMSFENLIAILRNYQRYDYKNVLVNDLEEERVQQIPGLFALDAYRIVSLVVTDVAEFRRRILNPARDSGYRDVERAWDWNQRVLNRPLLPNEFRIDSTTQSPEQTAQVLLSIVRGSKAEHFCDIP